MQSKICVLQVIPNLDVSGASQGCVDVANFLSEKNYNSYILTHSGPKSIEVKDSNEKVFYAPVNSKNPLKIFLNTIKIIQLIKKLNITIVHARSRAPAWSSFFACAVTGAKFITTFHGTYNFSNPLKKYYNSIMLKTNGTIAISEFINDHINNCYQTKNNNIRTIARGVDLDFFDPNNCKTQQVELIIKEFNIDNDAIKILLAGRITGWKGHKLLLQAISSILKKTNHKFEIIFVGPDENHKLKTSLKNFANEHNLAKSLHFVGPRNDLNNFYSLADLVISASTDPEAFGRISVEAQAMGKFVIASNHGGSVETVKDGETGYLFENNNSEDLCEKIIDAISNEKHKSDKTSEACISHVREKYSKIKMCEETINFYEEVIN